MSSRNTRANSTQPIYMVPTLASAIGARRANSAEPSFSTIRSTTCITRSNFRAGSIQPSKLVKTPTKPFQRAAKMLYKHRALSSRAGSVQHEKASSSKVTSAKPIQVGLTPAVAAPVRKSECSGYRDERFAREDRMGIEMAVKVKAMGLIDDETATKWSTPWHVKGHLELNWSEQIIAKYNAENGIVSENVMSLKEAEAIKKKKNAEIDKFCELYTAGLIDEDGNPIGKIPKAPNNRLSKSRIRDERREEVNKSLEKVESGKVTKKVGVKKTPELPTIAEASSPAPFPVAKLATKSIPKATTKPAPQAVTTNLSSKGTKKNDEAPLTPLPYRPTYAEYHYYQLTALCGLRNIMSGKGTQALRNRLIQDDINVIQGLPRDAKNYAKDAREKKHEAPVVPNAPIAPPAVYQRPVQQKKAKRNREDEDDNEESEPKGKKVKTT